MPLFAIPGDGRYPVQPVHIDDLARICLDAANADNDLIVDAAGPQTLAFAELVNAVRRSVRSRAFIMPLPPIALAVVARALGLVVGDVVLTADEIKGLTAGLLVSHDPPLGQIAFTDWLTEHAGSIGQSYANELERHFTPTRAG